MKTGPIATLVFLVLITITIGNYFQKVEDSNIVITLLFCTFAIVQVLEKRE